MARIRSLSISRQREAEDSLGEEEIPWLPDEVFLALTKEITRKRKEESTLWIESIEAAAESVSTMPVSDANQLHPPSIVTTTHEKRLNTLLSRIEKRLESLEIDWLIERFNKLPPSLKKKFLSLISTD